MRLNSFVLQTYWNTIRALSSYLMSVKVELLTLQGSTSGQTTSTILSNWTTTEMLLEGGSWCCFHGLLGNIAILQNMPIALMSILRRWTYLYLWTSFTDNLQIGIQCTIKSSSTLFNFLLRVWYSVVSSHSAYAFTCYWIIKSFHNPPP